MLFVKGERRMFKFITGGLSFRLNKSLVNLLLATSLKQVERNQLHDNLFLASNEGPIMNQIGIAQLYNMNTTTTRIAVQLCLLESQVTIFIPLALLV